MPLEIMILQKGQGNLLKKQKYQVDNQLIKEYFPIDVVLKGMFEIYETLLGVEYVKEKAQTWHEGVSVYTLNNSRKH